MIKIQYLDRSGPKQYRSPVQKQKNEIGERGKNLIRDCNLNYTSSMK